ncbi:MAG: hypothetical protein WBV94_31895 [Blastocatellia bacterium]
MRSVAGDPVAFILSKLKQKRRAGKGWTGLCPAHDDRKFSLSIGRGSDGKVLLNCHAGCSIDSICAAFGLSKADLFTDARPSTSQKSDWDIVATYDYHNRSGQLVYQHARYRNRQFTWRAPDDQGGWRQGLFSAWFERWNDGVWRAVKDKDKNVLDDPDQRPHANARWFDEVKRTALYKEARLREALPGSLVAYVEGEKDQHTATRLGLVSTTAGGANDWQPSFAQLFTDLNLVIFPDNDSPGEKLAQKVAADCYEGAESVRIVRLPDLQEHGDLSDWVESKLIEGLNISQAYERLNALIENAPLWKPELEDGQVVEKAIREAQRAIIRASMQMKQECSDPALTEDKSADSKLRSLSWNAARVVDVIMLLMAALGFEGNHYRLINSLIAFAKKLPNPLAYFTATHSQIYSKYRRAKTIKDRSKTGLVGADITKLKDEMKTRGYFPVDYIKGGLVGFGTAEQQGYGSKFRLQILRYALITINLSDRVRDEFRSRSQADEWAVQQVAAMIPRIEPAAKVENNLRAEARAKDPTDFDKLKAEFMRAAAAEFDRIAEREAAKPGTIESLSERVDVLASELISKINRIASESLCKGLTTLTEIEQGGVEFEACLHVHESMDVGTLFEEVTPDKEDSYLLRDEKILTSMPDKADLADQMDEVLGSILKH